MDKRYFRSCPQCGKELSYSNKKNRNTAEKKMLCCISCSHKNAHLRPEVILKNKERAALLSKKYKGSGNPFFGKRHTEESKVKMIKDRDFNIYKTAKFKEKMSKVTSGKNNAMYGKNFYDIWVKKYGVENADLRMKELSEIRSVNSSGSNNPMYGKPSPHGSGGGWSGWYKGWYFRSLRELSYMVEVIEKNKIKWRSAEKGIKIKYKDHKGNDRTYRPDFILEDRILIEIKPEKLMNTPLNVKKKEAAINFCKDNGLEYRIVDVDIMNIDDILNLWLKKEIKFVEKYEERIQVIFNKERKLL